MFKAPINLTRSDRQTYRSGGRVPEGQPRFGTAGMASGSHTRGNAAVRRAAQKRRNVLTHRARAR